jgi:hypothetical protein
VLCAGLDGLRVLPTPGKPPVMPVPSQAPHSSQESALQTPGTHGLGELSPSRFPVFSKMTVDQVPSPLGAGDQELLDTRTLLWGFSGHLGSSKVPASSS